MTSSRQAARISCTLVAGVLVDEYWRFVFPVVVGRGTRLFKSADVSLRLLEARRFVSGAVLLRYATGESPTGRGGVPGVP